MANVTKSVIAAGGGDYTTVQAALNAADVSTGYYKVEVQDNSEYDENLSITSTVGTPSATNYVWLTAASANRHVGVAGLTHARIKNTVAGDTLNISVPFTKVDSLEIHQASNGTGVGAILVTTTDVVVSRSVIYATASSTNNKGVILSGTCGLSIDNSIVYGFYEAGIYSYATTSTLNIDHVTSWGNGTAGRGLSGAVVVRSGTGSVETINVSNTMGCGTLGSYTDFLDTKSATTRNNPGGAVTWNGSNSLHTTNLTEVTGTDNTTAWQDASSGGATVTTTTANAVIFTNLTAGTEDLTPVVATGAGSNLALGNGINRIGSEPDSRQDFSIDIAGSIRLGTDLNIGAFKGPTSAGPIAVSGSASNATDVTGNLTGGFSVAGLAPSASAAKGNISVAGVLTKSVIAAGGGDYTTVQAAVNAADVTNGIWKIEIQDNSTYNESVSITSVVGTPSITNYIWLTVAAANRHAGIDVGNSTTSHAVIRDSVGSACILAHVSYTRMEYLDLYGYEVTTNSFKSGIRCDVSNITGLLASRCIFRRQSWGLVAQFNGLYIYNGADISVDNCVFYHTYTVGVFSDANGGTVTMDAAMDHCTEISLSTESSGNLTASQSGGTVNAAINNSVFGTSSIISSGSPVLSGSGNVSVAALPAGITGAIATNGLTDVAQTSGSWIEVVSRSTNGAFDGNVLEDTAFNLVTGGATNRIGSEPDSRQDFSLDIAGTTRGTTNVSSGAFVLTGVAVSVSGSAASVADAAGGLSGDVPISGSAPNASDAIGALSGNVPVSGSIPVASGLRGNAIGSVPVGVSASSAAGSTGALALQGVLASSTSNASGIKGSLALSGPISGSAPTASSAKGDLTGFVPISGSAASSSGTKGSLAGSVPISGSASSTSEAAGLLSLIGQKAVSGSASAASEVKGSLTGIFTLVGSAAGAAGAKGQTAGDVPISGSIPNASGTSGSLSGDVPVSGSASASSSAKGDLTGSVPVTGSTASSSEAKGSLTSAGYVTGTASGASGARAGMTVAVIVTGSVSASSGVKGNLSGSVPIAGSASNASGAAAAATRIVFIFGSAGSATEISAGATVGVQPDSGSSSSASGLKGDLSGGRSPFVTRWQLANPSTGETYVFTTNPTSGGVPASSKQIVYSNTVAVNGKTLIYERTPASQEVNLQGTVLTKTELEALELWASKRSALTLTDDLLRTYTIYISSFVAKRIRKASHPYYHQYTLSYIII